MGKRHKNTPAAPSKDKVVRHKKRINRKTKINLVFDKNARKDFLTGFHKRKVQRQLKAKEEMNEAMKAEKKRIKDEARNLHKTLVVSHRDIPELEELLAEEETYEFDEHNVVVREISTSELAEENCWIGENKSTYDNANEEEGDENSTDKDPVKLHTSKEIKKAVRNLSTQQIKKSKIFKKKGKMEQRRSRKTAGRRKKKGALSKRDKHNNGAKITRGR